MLLQKLPTEVLTFTCFHLSIFGATAVFMDFIINEKTKGRAVQFLHFGILIPGVLLAYYKIFTAGFMSWDDAEYITRNADIKEFSLTVFTKFYLGNYEPVTMLSYAMDFMFGGNWCVGSVSLLLF